MTKPEAGLQFGEHFPQVIYLVIFYCTDIALQHEWRVNTLIMLYEKCLNAFKSFLLLIVELANQLTDAKRTGRCFFSLCSLRGMG